jgi:uncharacterized coiled-coil protein SlyX
MNEELKAIREELASLKTEAERLQLLAQEQEAANNRLHQRIIDLESACAFNEDTIDELRQQRDMAADIAEQWKLNAEICYETCDELRERVAMLEAPTPLELVDGGS